LRIAHSNDGTIGGKEEPGRTNDRREIDGACARLLKIKPLTVRTAI
jgi:hypothetical protein